MAASGSKSMSSVQQRRGSPSQGQPEWWRAGRGASLKENSQLCYESETREQRIVLRPRTGLNGGERGQEQGRQAKKQEEEVEDRKVRGTFRKGTLQ